ncbi:response regulator [Pseudomonas sp.]|uniref:response regulator n=1 Tax=Pseudomonas sp. TaxID=306 RepID=UPI00338EE070
MLLSEIISDSGADCHVFTNCDQALMYLSAGNTCEAVIADHGVPGKLQGTEFIRKVQELWPRVRCVLTSGYDLSTIELPGNCIYLPKPWTPASLLGALG